MTARDAYKEFEASELFCPTCREPRPVRKYLLLVLPGAEKFDYRCAVCGTPVGSKTSNSDGETLLVRPR